MIGIDEWPLTAGLDLVLFGAFDAALTPLVYALHVGLIALVLASIGEARRADPAGQDGPEPAVAPAGFESTAPNQGPVRLPAGAGAFAPA